MLNFASANQLQRIGANFELITLNQAVHSVKDVQNACNCESYEVIKTLLFIGINPIIVIIPGDKRANILKLIEITDEQILRMASPDEVKTITGHNVGSLSPFGIKFEIKQFADISIKKNQSLILGSGISNILIKISKDEFCKSFLGKFYSITD